jgi:hypothetical protein
MTHAELYRACFLIVALREEEEKEKKENNEKKEKKGKKEEKEEKEEKDKKKGKEVRGNKLYYSKSHVVWEWNVDVSKQSLVSFLRDAGLLLEPGSTKGSSLSSLDVEKILSGLHCHSTYHGKRAQRLLFPEFCEVIVAIGSHMMDAVSGGSYRNGGGTSGGVGLSYQLDRIRKYLAGDAIHVVLNSEHQKKLTKLADRIRDTLFTMRKDRCFSSLTNLEN